jgi:hypothetical protein
VQTGGFTSATTYWLRATDAAGDSVDASVTVTPQVVTLSATGPSTPALTAGKPLTFAATVGGAADPTVLWSATGGSWSGSTWTAPATAGSVTITAAAQADPTVSWTTTATVVDPPQAPQLTLPGSVAAGRGGYAASVLLQGSRSTYLWALTGASLTSGQGSPAIAFTVTAPPGGTVTLACTVTNPAGDSATGSQSLVVLDSTVTLPGYLELLPGAVRTVHAATSDGAGVQWTLVESGAGTLTALDLNSVTLTAPTGAGPWHLVATSLSDPSQSATLTFGVMVSSDGLGTPGLDNLADLLNAYGTDDPTEELSGDATVDDADLGLLLDYLFGGGS